MSLTRANKPTAAAGFSLVEAMVTIAIVGVGALLAAQVLTSNRLAQRRLALTTERNVIRNYLLASADCAATFKAINPATCPRLVEVVTKNGVAGDLLPLVSADSTQPTLAGSWTLRALCIGPGAVPPVPETQWGILVQAARLKPGVANPLTALATSVPTPFLPDPFGNGALNDWDSPASPASGREWASDLFPKNMRLCSANFRVAAGSCPVSTREFCGKSYLNTTVKTGDLKLTLNTPGLNFCNPAMMNKTTQLNRYYPAGAGDTRPQAWTGEALCDPGYVATGGGVTCDGPPSAFGVCTGILTESRMVIVPSGQSAWHARCCQANPECQADTGNRRKNRIWVSCIKAQ